MFIYRGIFHVLQRYTTTISLICLTACGSTLAQNNPPSPAPTDAVINRVVALGKLVPEGDVIKVSAVNAKDSRLNQIMVKEGDFVQANQVIAILQGRDQAEQQIKDAQANVAIKQAQLQKIQQGDVKQGEIAVQHAVVRELEIRLRTESKQKQAEIASSQATIRNAQLKYQRYVSLNQAGAIKRSDLDDAREGFDKATATLNLSLADLDNTISTLKAQLVKEQANLRRLKEVRPIDVQIAKAELEQAQIQVEQRKAEIDNTQVRVPVAGQILRLNTHVGEQVNTQDGIAEVGQTKQMYAIAEVQETDVVKVKVGQRATLKSEYGGFNYEIRGTVAQVGLQIGKTHFNQDQNNPNNDVNARVVEVKIRIEPEDSPKVATLTGMQVRVKIDVAS